MRYCIVLPVHNEETTIEHTIGECLDAINKSAPNHSGRILVSEDGSRDRTRELIEALATASNGLVSNLPPAAERLGYSLGVVRGMQGVGEGELICTMDSDGQCNPADLVRLVDFHKPGRVVVGVRTPRADSAKRKIYSFLFGIVFRAMFRVRLKDPSSPMIVVSREDAELLALVRPRLKYGFWWEFQAHVKSLGLEVWEEPVEHRVRDGGESIYEARRLPGIVASHLVGLFRVRRDLSSASTK